MSCPRMQQPVLNCQAPGLQYSQATLNKVAVQGVFPIGKKKGIHIMLRNRDYQAFWVTLWILNLCVCVCVHAWLSVYGWEIIPSCRDLIKKNDTKAVGEIRCVFFAPSVAY